MYIRYPTLPYFIDSKKNNEKMDEFVSKLGIVHLLHVAQTHNQVPEELLATAAKWVFSQ